MTALIHSTFPQTFVHRTGDFCSAVFSGLHYCAGRTINLNHAVEDPAFAGYCLDAPAFIVNGRTYFSNGQVQIGSTRRD